MERPLTTGEIATHCHVTHRAVLKWIHNGKLTAYRTPGNHSRIKIKDFIDFLQNHAMPIPPEFQAYSSEKKVLIVDDDRNIANAIKRILTLEGNYKIDIAYDGFDAGRKFLGLIPDIVLLDIKMPGMDGYEVAKKMKELSNGKELKIIAMSAFFDETGKERMLQLGANFCLDKPFSKEALLEKFHILLGDKKIPTP